MQTWKSFLTFGLMLAVACPAIADETPKEEKGQGRRREPSATQKLVSKLELTDEQRSKVAELDKQFGDKLKELTKARTEILTPEQIKAEAAAKKEAKAAGKTGADARKAVEAAVALKDEQKEKLKEWTKAQNEFHASVVAELKKVLTPEQLAQLPKEKGGKGKGKKNKEEDASK